MSDGTYGQVVRTDAQVTAPSPQHSSKPAPQQFHAAPVQDARPPQTEARQRRQTEAVRPREQLSLDELADMLRKLNLTFDLFEIETEFSVDMDDHQIRVVVRNTRTNEVIRRIPAHEFEAQFTSFRDGVGLLIDSFL